MVRLGSVRQWHGKRLAVAALVLAGACALGIHAALPFAIPERLVRAQLHTQLDRLSDGAVRLGRHEGVSLHPGGRIVVAKPEFKPTGEGPARWRAGAEAIETRLRLLPLLAGRVEVERPRVVRPDITLTGRTALKPSQVRAAAGFGAGDPGRVLEVTDGTVRYDDGRITRVILDDLDLRVTGGAAPRGVAIAAAFDAGALRLQSNVEIDDLALLGRPEGTRGSISLDVDAAGASESGGTIAQELRDLAGAGDSATFLRKVAAGIGLPSFTRLDAEGRISFGAGAVALEDATFAVGGQTLGGRLRVAVAPDQPLALRLREAQEAAEAALRAAEAAVERGDWMAIPVPTDPLHAATLDLELAGTDLSLPGLAFRRAALDLEIGDGSARVSVDGASDTLGLFDATATLSASGALPRIAMTGQVSRLSVDDTARLAARLAPSSLIGSPQLPRGELAATVRAEAEGRTLGDLVGAATGNASLRIEDGSLAGGDVIATLDSLADGREFMTKDKGPLIPSAGRTPFDLVEVELDLGGGAADLSRFTIAGERYAIDMGGAVSLRSGAAQVAGNARLFDGGQDPATPVQDPAVDLPFGVGGTLFAPVIAPGVPTVAAKLSAPSGDLVPGPGAE